MPTHLGRYAIHSEIASGGSATVFLGEVRGPVFSRCVAIKRLHDNLAKQSEFVSMLVDEARIASRIHHPNVVQILDSVAQDGELFLVMEYVHGESLGVLARTARTTGMPIPLGVVSAIVSGALHGLHAAHEAVDANGHPLGVVHRDVSPSNVLVGVDGLARITDFGIARAARRLQTTGTGGLKGTLAYMAPEQLAGDATPASDLFATGVLLWELLANERLFGNREHGANSAWAPVAPARDGEPLPADLSAVVLRALASDPAERFPSALAMATALERAVPPATPSQVTAWVSAAAAATMARRLLQIREMESDLPVTEAGGPATPVARAVSDPSRHLGRWRGALAGAAFVALALVGALVVARRARPDAAPAAAALPMREPIAAPPIAATSSAPGAAVELDAGGHLREASTAARHFPAPPRRPFDQARASCSPPFVLDGAGHRIYKAECF